MLTNRDMIETYLHRVITVIDPEDVYTFLLPYSRRIPLPDLEKYTENIGWAKQFVQMKEPTQYIMKFKVKRFEVIYIPQIRKGLSKLVEYYASNKITHVKNTSVFPM